MVNIINNLSLVEVTLETNLLIFSSIGVTPAQVDIGLIGVTPIERLSQGNGDEAGIGVVGTLNPGACTEVEQDVLQVNLAILTPDDVHAGAVLL